MTTTTAKKTDKTPIEARIEWIHPANSQPGIVVPIKIAMKRIRVSG